MWTARFLGYIDCKKPDGSLKVKVFRKATHTDQYLLFSSNHPLSHKLGVVRTLHNRAKTIVSEQEDKDLEVSHVNSALKTCGYPKWAITRAIKPKVNTETQNRGQRNSNQRTRSVPIPYIGGLSDRLQRTFKARGINSYVRPQNTLRQLLCQPKDKTDKEDICGPVYYIKCQGKSGDTCSQSYIGETERPLKARLQEHRRPSCTTSEVSKHINTVCPGHKVDFCQVQILSRDANWYTRGIREAIHIRLNKPTLNRDGGRFQLPHIWDSLIKVNVPKPTQ